MTLIARLDKFVFFQNRKREHALILVQYLLLYVAYRMKRPVNIVNLKSVKFVLLFHLIYHLSMNIAAAGPSTSIGEC
jgi:hypothetical protein